VYSGWLDFAPAQDGKFRSVQGDSFVAAVEFSTPVRAMVLTSYGNATQPGSPHVGDQLELFARKKLRPAWRSRKEIKAHLESHQVFQKSPAKKTVSRVASLWVIAIAHFALHPGTMLRLKAAPRDLVVTYQDGPTAPCPCVVDGIMLATIATPGQNSLHALPTKSNPDIFGIAVIQNQKTGQALRYTLPASAGLLLDAWNKGKTERDRYTTVINAPQARLFYVEALFQPRKQLQAPLNRQH